MKASLLTKEMQNYNTIWVKMFKVDQNNNLNIKRKMVKKKLLNYQLKNN